MECEGVVDRASEAVAFHKHEGNQPGGLCREVGGDGLKSLDENRKAFEAIFGFDDGQARERTLQGVPDEAAYFVVE